MRMKINVVYFFRKPFEGYFSIEELFGFIQSALPEHISFSNYYLKRYSKGLFDRLLSCFEVIPRQGQINHITGDVHFIALFLRKKRTVLTIHDLEVLRRLKGVAHLIIKFFWFWMPARRVRYITVISEFTRKILLEQVPMNPEKVVVIHNCVSPAIAHLPKPFNKAKPKILHLGTAHNKNLERLIEALVGLNVHLTIVGNLRPYQRDLLIKNGIEYSNYYQLPYDEIIRLYQETDLVAFVSLYEGFGMPIIEAQATGRAVITSNCTSMPEVAGEAALLVDPENVSEIRQAIVRLIEDDDLRNELITKGLMNAQRFKPEEVAGQYAALYEKMIKSLEP